MPRKPDNLIGQSFGLLTVVGPSYKYRGKNRLQECACYCGRTCYAKTADLRSGRKQSCGCRRRPITPGLKRRRFSIKVIHKSTYSSWKSMMQRCYLPTAISYPRYGGRGIIVCERWRDFVVFLEDMGPRPGNTSLDRIDSKQNYTPDNCRWATVEVQNRHCIRWSKDGISVRAVAKQLGVHPSTIRSHLRKGETMESTIIAISKRREATGENASRLVTASEGRKRGRIWTYVHGPPSG